MENDVNARTMTTEERIDWLKETGAWYGKAEARGDDRTRTGWWLDGVFLAETERLAIEIINGG